MRGFLVVRVAGFEPTASWTRTMRATNCATPGYLNYNSSFLSCQANSAVFQKIVDLLLKREMSKGFNALQFFYVLDSVYTRYQDYDKMETRK